MFDLALNGEDAQTKQVINEIIFEDIDLIFQLLQTRQINNETVLHITFQDTFVGFINLLDGDDFDIGCDSVFGAEGEHFLSFFYAANQRANNTAALENQVGDRGRWVRVIGQSHQT